jgi:lysozyme
MAGLNVVVDLSHHNGNVDLAKAKAAGIVGVIHKATQGLTYMDNMYITNRTHALQNGLYWGAYHFGVKGNGAGQADFFLSKVNPDAQTLLVLDFEQNTTTPGQSMTLQDAHDFVTQIHAKTGRWPGLYSGSYIKQLLGSKPDPVLANCWFWLAQYGSNAVVPANWPTWTMWQYTDGVNGPQPHSVDGIGNCDRDTFNGDMAGLQRIWGIPVPAEEAA